jgi:Lung seven transmembrane receptor
MGGITFVTSSSLGDYDDEWMSDLTDDTLGEDDTVPRNDTMAPQRVNTPAPRPAPTAAPQRTPTVTPQQEPTAAPQGLTVAPAASPSSSPGEPQDVPTAASEGPKVAPTSSPMAPQEVPAEAPQLAPTNPATPMTTASPVAAPDADGGDAPSEIPTPSPAGRRHQARALDEGAGKGAQKTNQVIDILIFRVPDDCKRNRWGGCDWSVLGVGMRDEWMPGGVAFCCSAEAVSNGSCSSDELGRILIDSNSFTGRHVTIDVPSEENTVFTIDDPEYQVEITGDYIMLFANCFADGMDVFVEGYMATETEKGYKLPGELHDLMYFYAFMTVIFFLVILWYYCGMRMFQEASIPIQRFILATLILGLVEFFFRALDLGLWNVDGTRSEAVIWIGG